MIDPNRFVEKKAAYFTLGCKLNFAETSSLGRKLSEVGIRKVRSGESADVCIINTCTVTELADKKSRQAIRRIKKQHPSAYMIVTGCYAQLDPEALSSLEEVDLIVGSNQKMDIAEHLENILFGKNDSKNRVIPVKDIRTFVPSCSADDRTRHFLKVQDGCDYYCTYCTIPFARGRSRNGRIDELAAMAEKAGAEGGKEIVLTGVNIGDFGKSTGETFFDLIRALDSVPTVDRFRISSIEPNLLTDEILDFVTRSSRFTPHFHIPLQSGSDAVLKLMNRRYDTSLFASKIYKIRELMPEAFIGVDVIVGSRGETDTLFEETLNFLNALPFSQLHVFTYSERRGTQALKIEPVVDANAKQLRSRQLLDLSDRKMEAFYRSQIGTKHTVLFEHARKGKNMHGFTENYIRVEADYDINCINKLIPVTLGDFNEDKTALKI